MRTNLRAGEEGALAGDSLSNSHEINKITWSASRHAISIKAIVAFKSGVIEEISRKNIGSFVNIMLQAGSSFFRRENRLRKRVFIVKAGTIINTNRRDGCHSL